MVKLVSSAAALKADRLAESEFNYPPTLLMEEAGIRLQDRLEALLPPKDGRWEPLVYLVGPGNNGGDALVMARQAYLRGRRNVSVVSVFPAVSESSRWQTAVVRKINLPVYDWPSAQARDVLSSSACWVDGLFGSGLSGRLRPDREGILQDLEALRRECGALSVAIDIPSGLWEGWSPSHAVLTAKWTLSPGWLKDFCFYPAAREVVGVAKAVGLAFPAEAEPSATLVEDSDLTSLLPTVSPFDHKGKRGHVALVGGAVGMSGALVLAARSAAASGAGLISLGVDSELTPLIAPQVPAFQVRSVEELCQRFSRYDALVVGPGWGPSDDRMEALKRLWSSDLPLVLDADGLGLWSRSHLPPRRAPWVITPHPGEFLKLDHGEPTVASAIVLAKSQGCVVVLKGAVTWIVAPDGRRSVWDGHNPALGTGGSGDCLAGVVGAMLARGLQAFEAATAGVALHGVAGQKLATQVGWFTADKLPEALAQVAAACAPRLA